MTAADIIDALGGSKAVQGLTGLSKGRISQWRTEDHIPRPWLRFLETKRPDIFKAGARRKKRAVAGASA